MKEKKYYIALDDFERRVVVNCVNEMRNKLIADGKYTDALDEVLLKVIHLLYFEKFRKEKDLCPNSRQVCRGAWCFQGRICALQGRARFLRLLVPSGRERLS